jgi:hypothetical protein
MFFKKGLRDPSLIHKLAVKNSKSSEEMPAIDNKYTIAEEATLDNRETKKDKESSQSDRPSTSKTNDKKRKHYHSIATVKQPQRNRIEYWPRPGEFECFLEGICIFHPRENTRLRTATGCKVLQMRFLSWPKRTNKTRSPKTQRATSHEA